MTENKSKYGNIAIIGGGRGSGRTLKAHLDILQELEAYRAIGTIEEFKDLKEKSVAKKPIRSATSMYGWDCPNCKDYVYNDYWDNDTMPPKRCDICGQALDWSE